MKNIKLLPILLFIFFPVCAQNNVPRVYISNGQIKALLYLPDNAKGYYRGTRFDRSGIVASLKYEGHEFFGKWFDKYDPFTHDAIMGPVEEFGEEGYENTPLGGTFLKLGVGLLIKPDAKPYDHFRLYPFKNPGKWKVKTSGDEVVYIQTLKDESYSYIYEKHIRLTAGKPEMVISHRLRNIGKLPLSTNVYDHNFPVIDKQAVGPGYVISFPFKITGSFDGPDKLLYINDKKLTYQRDQTLSDMLYIDDLPGYSDSSKDYDFRYENLKAGAGFRVTGDKPIIKLAYWSSTTTVCAEPYIKVEVQPGEEITWELKYEFYQLKN